MRFFDWLRSRLRGADPDSAPIPKNGLDCPPLSAPQLRFLHTKIYFHRCLTESQQTTLQRLVARFLEEKRFWGSQDLQVTPEMKLTVAAWACLPIIELPHFWVYPHTREVIIYPGHFGETVEAFGPDGRRWQVHDYKIGETWHRGPVLLAWRDVERLLTRRRPEGHNVVIHEFVHALDFLDRMADGTPPLADKTQFDAWVKVFTDELEALREADRAGRRTFLDPYGATNPAEFFAVAGEAFFELPGEMRRLHPELYNCLKDFYRQDPAEW